MMLIPTRRSPPHAPTFTIHDTAEDLGIELTNPGLKSGRRDLAECPACGDRRPGSAKVYEKPKGTGFRWWFCHRCDVGGGNKELYAWTVRGESFMDLDSDQLAKAFHWARHRGRGPVLKHPSSARPSAPAALSVTDITAFWEDCLRVTGDKKVMTWAKARGLDPAAVKAGELLRALPPRSCLPGFALRWAHHRGIVPLWDHRGGLAGVRARDTRPSPPPKSQKELVPLGSSVSGLIMANSGGQDLLTGKCKTPALVVITEGTPDFLTWATTRPDWVVFGVFSGAWSDEHAACIPDGSTVVIRTHHDETGEKYAAQIRATLEGRCEILRSKGKPGEDENDRLLAGTLPNRQAMCQPERTGHTSALGHVLRR